MGMVSQEVEGWEFEIKSFQKFYSENKIDEKKPAFLLLSNALSAFWPFFKNDLVKERRILIQQVRQLLEPLNRLRSDRKKDLLAVQTKNENYEKDHKNFLGAHAKSVAAEKAAIAAYEAGVKKLADTEEAEKKETKKSMFSSLKTTSADIKKKNDALRTEADRLTAARVSMDAKLEEQKKARDEFRIAQLHILQGLHDSRVQAVAKFLTDMVDVSRQYCERLTRLTDEFMATVEKVFRFCSKVIFVHKCFVFPLCLCFEFLLTDFIFL